MHNQVELERKILEFWESQKIYEQVKKARSGGKVFYFCDGPPYATGQIHPGTAWNKVIKDAICRYKRFRGFAVRSQPGYDTHGLPIEVKVEQTLNISNKRQIEELGVEAFIQKCKAFATQYIGIISQQFIRCGVWMDFDNPYITYTDDYIEASWKTLEAAYKKGLLHEGLYVVPYCSRCETTLANYELEYGEQKDPSIYVKFKSLSNPGEYFIIWTTTPWTLISNMAIMAHPIFTYVKVKVEDEVWILAKERLEHFLELTGKSATILGELSGKKLEKEKYAHPLQHKIKKEYPRQVVLSDEFVSLEDGSGLVHCAPGHGPEDFIIGKRFGIEIFSPVDSSGKFTKEAGDYVGIDVREASALVIEDLKKCGALVHSSSVVHRYPHCWRCKTPLIFIATNQWFISITKLKEKMLSEIENCEWHPPFAKTRFKEFVSGAPDWCISRQRYWGIPLPIWRCDKCKHIKLIGSKEELPPLQELHRPYIDKIKLKCEKCGSFAHRIPDILDVWFDSGNAVWASLSKQERTNPSFARTDFIVEGKDQTRGWFYSLLGSGVVLNGEIPYKAVLMHGFFVDEKGEKMSKSLGNFVPLEDIVDKYGADTFRLWALSNTVWDDLRFNWNEIKEAHRTLGTIYNLGVFLSRFYLKSSKPKIDAKKLLLEDRWLLSRLSSTIVACQEAFESYQPHIAAKAIREFLLEDVSRFYMKLAKQRIDEEGSECVALNVLYTTILDATILLSPIAPFISESIYQSFYRKYEEKASISLFEWPAAKKELQDAVLEQRFSLARQIAAAISAARQKAGIPLRWPLEEAKIVSSSTEVLSAIEHTSEIIKGLGNIRKITAVEADRQPKTSIQVSFNKTKIGAKFKKETSLVLSLLEKADAKELADWFATQSKPFLLGGKFEIEKEMLEIHETAAGFSIARFDGGVLYLDTKIKKHLYEEAMVREVARRIQLMRKQAQLVETDKIMLYLQVGDKELESILRAHIGQLSKQVNAVEILFQSKRTQFSKEWEIQDTKISISLEKSGTSK
ncbi:MAG: isoleucine--tRNA ligase [Candidatus Micrarchaeota archaeon]|nr:isoleucine--tRNA ligase [Candidatus Micrarchaeota archaeon]